MKLVIIRDGMYTNYKYIAVGIGATRPLFLGGLVL